MSAPTAIQTAVAAMRVRIRYIEENDRVPPSLARYSNVDPEVEYDTHISSKYFSVDATFRIRRNIGNSEKPYQFYLYCVSVNPNRVCTEKQRAYATTSLTLERPYENRYVE
jgi:hypothetical protein